MESIRNEIQQHFLNVRKLILDARYYQDHRPWWQEDKSANCIYLAEENLKESERLIEKLK
jgi:hypothetical protein